MKCIRKILLGERPRGEAMNGAFDDKRSYFNPRGRV
jgi:hypothetical protein